MNRNLTSTSAPRAFEEAVLTCIREETFPYVEKRHEQPLSEAEFWARLLRDPRPFAGIVRTNPGIVVDHSNGDVVFLLDPWRARLAGLPTPPPGYQWQTFQGGCFPMPGVHLMRLWNVSEFGYLLSEGG